MSSQSQFGTAVADANPLPESGVLAIRVCTDRPRELYNLQIPDSAAARCIEAEDGIHWRDGKVYWSNRARTVRDIPLGALITISGDKP